MPLPAETILLRSLAPRLEEGDFVTKWTAKKRGTTSTRRSSGAIIRRPAIDGGGKWRPKSAAELPTAVDELQVTTLVRDLGQMIESAGRHVAVAANAALTTLYWQIGHRVRIEVLQGRRAEYGVQIVAAVGRQLEARHGRGFGEKNLRRMVQFAEVFPDPENVAALLRQLGWTHFTLLIPIKGPLKRAFYAEMCRIERWSTRELRHKIDGMLYEHTALSRKPEDLIRSELAKLREKDELTPALVCQDRHERQPDEAPPLGIILCAGKKRETVEYLDLDARCTHVAEYLTDLPPRKVLEERLHRAIEAARNRLAMGAGLDVDAPGPEPSASPGRIRGRKTR